MNKKKALKKQEELKKQKIVSREIRKINAIIKALTNTKRNLRRLKCK